MCINKKDPTDPQQNLDWREMPGKGPTRSGRNTTHSKKDQQDDQKQEGPSKEKEALIKAK